MTKPKNMTLEQEIAWKERDRLRRSTPEYKAKSAVRARRWYEQPGNKEKLIEATREKRKDDAFRAKETAEEVRRVQTNPVRAKKARGRQRDWNTNPATQDKRKKKSARYYATHGEQLKEKRRLNRQFDHFMRQMEGNGQ